MIKKVILVSVGFIAGCISTMCVVTWIGMQFLEGQQQLQQKQQTILVQRKS